MKYLDIENSYTYFNMNNSLSERGNSNIWRSSIVSTLTDLSINKKYYLNKECVSETIGKNPFLRQWGYLFRTITADDKTVTSFRTSANNQSGGNFRFQDKNHRTFIEPNENIITNKINLNYFLGVTIQIFHLTKFFCNQFSASVHFYIKKSYL